MSGTLGCLPDCSGYDVSQCVRGNNVYANSCSQEDVQAAIDSANDGDTVIVPAGSCVWNKTLVITKGLAVRGAGIDKTLIINNMADPLIDIVTHNDAVRVSGFSFNNSLYVGNSAIEIRDSIRVRIDHSEFINGLRSVHALKRVEGVIDHNKFLNCEIAVGITGDNDLSWERAIIPGTGNSLFIENNTFIITNNFPISQNEPEQQIYQQEGARTVTRYNLFDGSAYTDGNYLAYDSHGNQKYYNETSDFRGQPLVEVYGNEIIAHHSYRIIDFRGGSVLFYNNSLTTLSRSMPCIDLTEEEAWSSHFTDVGLDTEWPAEDQITNSFFWGNSYNGDTTERVKVRQANSECEGIKSPLPCCTGSGVGTCDDTFIQQGRDFFLHEPQAIGGRSIYTNRQGAAGNDDDGTLQFIPNEPNAYYPYIPYPYPHPLALIDTNTSTPQQCVHKADSNCDGKVNVQELINFIKKWKKGEVTIRDVIGAIKKWKNG